MKYSFRLSWFVPVVFVACIACGDDDPYTDPDLDCTAECDPECELDRQFEFESYEGGCEVAEDGPEFCGVSTSQDCVQPDFELEEVTVADIHRALENGEISCQWLMAEYFQRILWHDLYMWDSAPPLNAFVHLNAQAMDTARLLDEYQRCEGELAGSLHCVPFGIKTNYGSKEVPVTNGSLAFLEAQPTFDAFSVERLRQAGAIMIGSTAMDEFAFGAHGLSGRSGRTANPYRRDYNSGGSSAGSAVGTATGMMVAGLGTDNCASLTAPAAYNGLFTLRSSHQLVSTEGIVPSNRLDAVAGPMTRTAEDLALFFNEVTAFNPHYGPHCAEDIEREQDYTAALDADGLDGKRVGKLVALDYDPEDARYPFEGASAEVEDHYEAFFDELRAEGAEVVDHIRLSDLPLQRRSSGSGYDMDQFLEATEGEISSYEEICDTELYSHSVFETKDDCLNRAGQSRANLESRVESGLEDYRWNRDYVESVLDEHNLDALVYPSDTNGTAAPQFTNATCVLASVTGLPTAVVPTGHTEAGLPVGMSLTGRMFDDAMLLEMAYAYDQATDHRQPPPMPALDGQAPLEVEEFNDLHYQLGVAAYEQVLKDDSKFDLRASVFSDIAADVLDEHGWNELVE